MPSLYGNGANVQGLYGNVLSARNQAQAQQLNLPGAIQQPGGAGQAGSQEAAQSDWANFEDIFNKNRGYSARMQEGAVGKVRETAGETPNTAAIAPNQPNRAPPGSKAPAPVPQMATTLPKPATAELANPNAPAALQAPSLTGIQNKADLLSGYGQQAQATLPAGVGVVGSSLPTLRDTSSKAKEGPAEKQALQSQSYANTAGGQKAGVHQNLLPPLAPEQNVLPPAVEAPPAPVAEANAPPPPGAVPADAVPRPVEARGDVDPETLSPEDRAIRFANSELNNLGPDDEPTPEELDKLDKLTKANDLLVGYGGGVDSMGEVREGDEGLDILQQVYGSGAGEWDAAIMNTGGGRTAFGELQKQYGGKYLDERKNIATRVTNDAYYRKSLLDQIANLGKLKDAPEAAPVDNAIRIGAIPTSEAGQVLGVTEDIMKAWQALPPETARAQMMGNKNYVEASGEKSSLPGLLHGTFGVSSEDANLITSYLTPEDWAAYQAALEQAIGEKNPRAIIAWISGMLTKTKGG